MKPCRSLRRLLLFVPLVAAVAPPVALGAEELFLLGEAAAPCTEMRRSPRLSAAAKQCLAPGTAVRLLRSFEDWRRVRLDDGSKGWLPASVLVPPPAAAGGEPATPATPAATVSAASGSEPDAKRRTRVLVPLAYEEEQRETAESAAPADEDALRTALATAEARSRELEAELQASRQQQRELLGRLERAEGALAELRRQHAAEGANDAVPAPAPADDVAVARPSDDGSPDVLPMLKAWAAAWSEQRVEEYLAFYAPDFRPPQGDSRDAWEASRRRRISAPDSVRVTLSSLGVRPLGADRASVRFTQRYESESYEDVVRKRLELVRVDGAWKIAEEHAESP